MYDNDRNHDWVLEITDVKQAVIQSSYSMSRSGHVFTKLALTFNFICNRRMKKQDGSEDGRKGFDGHQSYLKGFERKY
jgi:hypothetical protein